MKKVLLQFTILLSLSLGARERKEISSFQRSEKEHELWRVQQSRPIYDSIHTDLYMWMDSIVPIIRMETTISKDVDSDSIVSTLNYYVEGNEKQYFKNVKSYYDDEGRLVKELEYSWKYDTWVKSYETTYTYDITGKMITKIFNHMNWGVVTKSEYFYNDHNTLIAEYTYLLYESTSTWKPTGKLTYELDDKERVRSSSFWAEDTRGGWYESSKQEISYNQEGTFKEVVNYLWNPNLNEWTPEKTEAWYGEDGRPLLTIKSSWYSDLSAFAPFQKVVYNYLPNSELHTTYEFGEFLPKWIKKEVNEFFYHQTPTRVFDKSIDASIQVYPNPTTNKIVVNASQGLEYIIYDLRGNHVLSSSTAEIDVAHLPKGAYMLKIHTVKGTESRTFIKD